jgi:hypothetical protein
MRGSGCTCCLPSDSNINLLPTAVAYWPYGLFFRSSFSTISISIGFCAGLLGRCTSLLSFLFLIELLPIAISHFPLPFNESCFVLLVRLAYFVSPCVPCAAPTVYMLCQCRCLLISSSTTHTFDPRQWVPSSSIVISARVLFDFCSPQLSLLTPTVICHCRHC